MNIVENIGWWPIMMPLWNIPLIVKIVRRRSSGHIDELGDGGVDMLAFDGPFGFYLQGLGLALF